MKQTAIRLPESLIEELDAEADDRGVNRSEYMRDILESRGVSQSNDAEYVPRDEFDDLERENERLNRERRQLLEQREENTELVRYAKEQRLESQSDKRRREHNIVRRVWWKVAGEPAEI